MSEHLVGSNMGHRDAEDFCREMPTHASEELEWLRERVQRLQRAEELLRQARVTISSFDSIAHRHKAYDPDAEARALKLKRIDAYFGDQP